MPDHALEQRIPTVRESLFAPRQRPAAKRPHMPQRLANIAQSALVMELLFVNAQLDEPQSLTWWADRCDATDIEAVFRALADANPRLLVVEDRRNTTTPALYLNRVDSCLVATLYYKRPGEP